MVYLLDTNGISDLMRADSQLEAWLTTIPESDAIVTCTIVRGEILFGIARLTEGQRHSALAGKAARLSKAMHREPIPERAADIYSHSVKTANVVD